jgi:hypothetical protein
MQPFLISGQRVVCSINQQTVSCGHVLDYSIETLHEELNTCDAVVPAELMPVRVRVALTLGVFRKPDDSPVQQGFAPAGTDRSSDQGPFSSNRYITIEVKDNVTDKTLMFLPRASIVRRSGSVEAEGLLSETWNIVSIGLKDDIVDQGLVSAVSSAFG